MKNIHLIKHPLYWIGLTIVAISLLFFYIPIIFPIIIFKILAGIGSVISVIGIVLQMNQDNKEHLDDER